MNRMSPLVVSLALVLAGCVLPEEPQLAPLEIQSLQTREFEAEKDVVFASTMSVFQDLGYIVNSADIETGFITAESTADSSEAAKFWLDMTSVSQTSATAFIERIGDFTRVRLNFVLRTTTSESSGQVDRSDRPILDAEVYQNAFERIDSAIFVRSAN